MSAETLRHFETLCRVCGHPLHLYLEPCGDGPLAEETNQKMASLAAMAIHDECARILDSRRAALSAIQLAERRTQSWAGICPPLFQDTERERLTAISALWAWIDAWRWGSRGLLVRGRTGIGKTRAIYWLLKREHLAEGRAIVALDHTQFAREAARMMFHEAPAARDRWLKLLGCADIFFLDDLGKSRFTTADGTGKQAEEILWDVCETRWKNKLPVFFTTNLDGRTLAREMSAARGLAFVRRIAEFSDIIKL